MIIMAADNEAIFQYYTIINQDEIPQTEGNTDQQLVLLTIDPDPFLINGESNVNPAATLDFTASGASSELQGYEENQALQTIPVKIITVQDGTVFMASEDEPLETIEPHLITGGYEESTSQEVNYMEPKMEQDTNENEEQDTEDEPLYSNLDNGNFSIIPTHLINIFPRKCPTLC
ncbi:unnamed protein product [Acanthoscelides obtectus]|uniref:Uncharacterized protein n=1 Tax=Acanthoscelides obtectus TaxID=200917 RepID=A0A9P0LMB4_ACAOB|nr:unnamed protein product [Acanthoscelides obtectus]CAK1644102.1 hypothetical protein AOBTE_LOCUS13828 [Acanthoscelides obtectus]